MKGMESINVKQILAMAVISLGYIHLGNVISFPTLLTTHKNSTLFNIYQKEMLITPFQLDRLSSMMALGNLIGCSLASFVTSKYGNKIVMYFDGLLAIIAWIGIALSPNVACLEVFRVLCGISMGIITIGGTNYLTEIVDPKFRGTFISLLDFFIVLGNFMPCALGYWLSFYEVAFVNATLPIIFTIGIFFLPESPACLVVQGKMKEVRAVLLEIRNKDANIEEELDIFFDVNVTQAKDKKVWQGLKMPIFIKRIAIILILYFIRCFAGYEVFVANPSRMFNVYEGINVKMTAVEMTIIQLICVLIFALFVIDLIGRRKSMLLSIVITSVSLLSLTGYHGYDQLRNVQDIKKLPDFFSLQDRNASHTQFGNEAAHKLNIHFNSMEELEKQKYINNSEYLVLTVAPFGTLFRNEANNYSIHHDIDEHNSVQPWMNKFLKYIPVMCILSAIIGFSMGLAPIPLVVMSEYFPTWLRAEATSICFAGFTVFQFLTLISYNMMLETFTTAGFFLLCSILCILATPLAIYCMPETMGQIVA